MIYFLTVLFLFSPAKISNNSEIRQTVESLQDDDFLSNDVVYLKHSPFKDQGETPLCWAVALTGMVESYLLNTSGERVSISEMFLWHNFTVEKSNLLLKHKDIEFLFPNDFKTDILKVAQSMEKTGVIPENVMPLPTKNSELFKKNLNDKVEELRIKAWETKLTPAKFKKQLILVTNKVLGVPPEKFKYQGKTYTPTTFFKKKINIKSDRYILIRLTNNKSLLKGPKSCKNIVKSGTLKVASLCYTNDLITIIKKSIEKKIPPYISWVYSKPVLHKSQKFERGFFSFKALDAYDRKWLDEKYFNKSDGIEQMVKVSWGLADYNSYFSFSHACTVVGYDRKKGILILKNTWGKFHTATDAGYFYFDNDFAKRFIFEVLTFKDIFE